MNDKPKVSPEAQEVINAFRILSSSRSGTGYGPNPISFADLKAYLDYLGETYLPKDIFVDLIYKVDRKFLQMTVELLKSKVASGRRTS